MKKMKPRNVRVAMLEDDASYMETLRLVIETDPRLVYVGGFRSPVRFLSALEELEFEVLLLDINLPKLSGIECIGEVKKAKPTTKVLMLTVEERRETVLEAFSAGADGYLLKDSSPEEVGDSILELYQNGAPMAPAVARMIVGMLQKSKLEPGDSRPSDELLTLLSQREREVLNLLSSGLRNAEIAERLNISIETVKTHIRSIYQKLGVRNRSEAVNHLFTRS